jgi:prepilin-type N-terminal cleavage/methylation domain-containing protein
MIALTLNRRSAQGRDGFTLVELMVVMGIIAVLAALTAAAVLNFLNVGPAQNTDLVLQKVDHALWQHWREITQQAQHEKLPASILSLAGGDDKRAQVILLKLRLKQEFPMSYAEALNPGGGVIPAADLPGLREYAIKLAGRTAAVDPNTESAACLLMALQRIRRGSTFNPDEGLGASGIRDTDGDGMPEIIDGWGRPILFYRWPSNNAEIQTEAAKHYKVLSLDLEDPDRTLMSQSWQVSTSLISGAKTNGQMFEFLCHPISQNGQPQSFFATPVVVSMGKDGVSGLGPFLQVVGGAAAADNAYSYQIR